MIKKYILIFVVALLSVSLTGCGTKQEPTATQIVYQMNDNRQITHIIGDNNTALAQAETKIAQGAEPETQQTTEATTKSQMWIFWTIALVLALVAGAVGYFYIKNKRI